MATRSTKLGTKRRAKMRKLSLVALPALTLVLRLLADIGKSN